MSIKIDFANAKRRYALVIMLCFFFLFVAARSSAGFKDAVAAWTFANPNDITSENSRLTLYGNVSFVKLRGDDARASKAVGGDGMAAQFNGGWFSAGQGINDELNLSGKSFSLLIRFNPVSIRNSVPLINKAGSAQSVAYCVSLNGGNDDVLIEALIGNDYITGAHYLKYKLPKGKIAQWHDIILRFNGKKTELYVDGVLGDEEVTVGELRNWNRKPFLIGAQYKPLKGYGTVSDRDLISGFEGLIDHVVIWNRYLTDSEVRKFSGVTELKDGRPEYYSEKYRPQFHFSAKKNGLNDPNGLVYYRGVYHLFFQCWGFPYRPANNKDWGHAVSTDLVHWKETDDHITPHKIWGGCWSGSAVIDVNNAAGFQTGDEKTIVAFITCIGAGDTVIGARFSQCIAYSTDGGRTFTYYDQNPVIRNMSDGNRDPKVVWDEQSQEWVMSLFMKGNDYAIFSSADLKEWRHLETVKLMGVAECPGFEPLPVDGDTANKKWIFFGANGNYVVGSFDGAHFTPETKTQRGDYGGNFYAAQTWNNAPDGRCLHIAWMATQPYPGMPFNQQMTFPTELTLRTTQKGIKAFRMPVREIENLYDKARRWNDQLLKPGTNLFRGLQDELYDMNMEIDVQDAPQVEIGIRNMTISYDCIKKTLSLAGNVVSPGIPAFLLSGKPNTAPLSPVDGKIKLRILVDRTSIEIFGNDGEVVMTSSYMPEDGNLNYSLIAKSDIRIVKAEVHSLKPVWTK